MGILLLLFALTFRGEGYSVASIQAQEEDELLATITALETRVAESDSTATPAAATTAARVSSSLEAQLFGPVDQLAMGEPGEIAIVARGEVGNTLALILRNNTSQDIYSINVAGEFRDSTGRLLGTGSDQGFVPAIVPPGGITLGYVYFPDGIIEDAELILDIEVDAPSTFDYERLLPAEVIEVAFTETRFIGTVRNAAEVPVEGSGIFVVAQCLDDSGTIIAEYRTRTDKRNVSPGEEAAFGTGLYGDLPCDPNSLIVAAESGH